MILKSLNSGKMRIESLSLACALALIAGLTSCGNKNCTIFDRAAGEPSCGSQRIFSKITPPPPASCAAPSSRNLSVTCLPGTGTTGMCTSLADGFPLVVFLVPNNASGNFTDTGGTGVTYTTCQQLLNDIWLNTVKGIKGVYVSDNSPGNRLNCDNISGCTMLSSGCFSGWDSTAMAASGTAAITAGSNVLACAYIDNSSIFAAPAPAAYGAWGGALVPFNAVAGTLNFTNSSPSTWQDAY